MVTRGGARCRVSETFRSFDADAGSLELGFLAFRARLIVRSKRRTGDGELRSVEVVGWRSGEGADELWPRLMGDSSSSPWEMSRNTAFDSRSSAASDDRRMVVLNAKGSLSTLDSLLSTCGGPGPSRTRSITPCLNFRACLISLVREERRGRSSIRPAVEVDFFVAVAGQKSRVVASVSYGVQSLPRGIIMC